MSAISAATPAVSGTLAARLPRCLLDPGDAGLPAANAEGLVAVQLTWQAGRIASILPLDPAAVRGAAERGEEPGAALPLAITPPWSPTPT